MIILAFSALTSVQSAPATEIVSEFLGKVWHHDTSAASMLSADATLGINDVAMPLSSATLDPFVNRCSVKSVAMSAEPTSVLAGRTITHVDATFSCSAKGKTRDLLVNFFVEGSKVSGGYIR